MNHFVFLRKPEHVFTEFVLPLLIQFGILAVMLVGYQPFVAIGPYIQPQAAVESETAMPTLGRLFFAFTVFALGIVCAVLASSQAKKGKSYLPFVLGVFSGMFFWQALGECFWHFTVGGIRLMQFESVQVFPLVIVFVLVCIYAIRNHSFDFGMWCVIISFACNWLGHYVMLGVYPFFEGFCDASVWNHTSSVIAGIIVFAVGIYMGLCASKDRRARMISSMIAYIGIGVIALGFLEG